MDVSIRRLDERCRQSLLVQQSQRLELAGMNREVREQLGERRRRLTLKLLCTRVSSKSMTMHFLCMSECRIGGRRYRLDPPLPVRPVACPIVCVWSASIEPPFWLCFGGRLDDIEPVRCLQQQNRVSHILRFGGFTFSSMFAATTQNLLINISSAGLISVSTVIRGKIRMFKAFSPSGLIDL